MITNLLLGSALVAITVIIHAMGLGMVLSHVLHSSARPDTRFWPIAWLLIRIAWFLIIIHFLEIAVWALFFWCYLRHHRLRGHRVAKGMAIIRASGGVNWHSDVRPLDGILLHHSEQEYSSTHG